MSLPPELLSSLGRVALWFYIKLFRADLLPAQPAKRTALGWLNLKHHSSAVI